MIFPDIIYHQESPTGDLFVLTPLRRLIKFIRQGDKYVSDIWKAIPYPKMQNFTFDKDGHILIPTGYILDPATLDIIGKVALPTLHQLSYLPAKDLYLGSDNNTRELYTFTPQFGIYNRSEAEDGCIFPRFNHNGNLVAYYSYDQSNKFYDLYKCADRPTFITSFYDWKDKRSSDLKFNGDYFAVAYHRSIAYYHDTTLLWEIDVPTQELTYVGTKIEFLSDNLLAIFKNRHLFIMDVQQQKVVNTATLLLAFNAEAGFPATIISVTTSLDKEHLIIITDVEIRLIKIKDVL